ncbi:MAG: hypothetical protein ACI4C7_09200 [Clostridia bacterium]
MRKEQILPFVIILIDLGSAVPHMMDGNWRKAVYWIAAAVLNIAVTF